MTCGNCEPQAYAVNGGRVFGYAVARCPSAIASQTSKLHYVGAAYVFADHPIGRIDQRPGFKKVVRAMRPGDSIVVTSLKALGYRRATQLAKVASLEANRISVFVLTGEELPPRRAINRIAADAAA